MDENGEASAANGNIYPSHATVSAANDLQEWDMLFYAAGCAGDAERAVNGPEYLLGPRLPVCKAQAELLREIVGNPFHPAVANPTWLTEDLSALAQSIYEQQAFERMPELANALDVVGCENAELLNHFRSAVQHVRGVWALDVLGVKGRAG